MMTEVRSEASAKVNIVLSKYDASDIRYGIESKFKADRYCQAEQVASCLHITPETVTNAGFGLRLRLRDRRCGRAACDPYYNYVSLCRLRHHFMSVASSHTRSSKRAIP